MILPDDFAIVSGKIVCVTTENSLHRTRPDDAVNVLIGLSDTRLLGGTPAQFGRPDFYQRRVVYRTSRGIPASNHMHAGQILAVNVEIFE